MEIQLLREPEIFPSKEVLKHALRNVYDILEELEIKLTQPEFSLTFHWHYYKDSKAWLCKVSFKKKTIFWLSVWEGFFKTSFFFLERHLGGMMVLNVKQNSFKIKKEWGKMIPVVFDIHDKEPFSDLIEMIKFKKKTK